MSDNTIGNLGFYIGVAVLSLYPLACLYMWIEYTPYKIMREKIDDLIASNLPGGILIQEVPKILAQLNAYEKAEYLTKEQADELRDKLSYHSSYKILTHKANDLYSKQYYNDNESSPSDLLQEVARHKYLVEEEIDDLKEILLRCTAKPISEQPRYLTEDEVKQLINEHLATVQDSEHP